MPRVRSNCATARVVSGVIRRTRVLDNPLTTHSRRTLIDVLAYGARVLHKQASGDDERTLAELRTLHGDAQVVMAINSSMRELLNEATLAYHPIRQDFDHWVSTGLIPKPNLTDFDELMSSDR
jgi:hypothetical protein